MSLGGGDQLARGGIRAQFTTPQVSEEKWKEMFGGDNDFEERMRKKALAEGLTEEQFEKAKEEAAKTVAQVEEQQKLEKQALQAKIKIRAIQDRVIVRRVEAEDKVGTFYVPDETKEKPAEGIVVAVGPGKLTESGWTIHPTVQVGERVVFGRFSGAEVKVGFETLLVLREEDLFLVKEKIEEETENTEETKELI